MILRKISAFREKWKRIKKYKVTMLNTIEELLYFTNAKLLRTRIMCTHHDRTAYLNVCI